MGPRIATGMNSSAPTIKTVPSSTTPKRKVSVRNVPADSGVARFAANEPAMASGAMIGMNRAKSITRPVAIFHGTVLSPSPSNPDPLLAAAELYSYRISLKPWLPGLATVAGAPRRGCE